MNNKIKYRYTKFREIHSVESTNFLVDWIFFLLQQRNSVEAKHFFAHIQIKNFVDLTESKFLSYTRKEKKNKTNKKTNHDIEKFLTEKRFGWILFN